MQFSLVNSAKWLGNCDWGISEEGLSKKIWNLPCSPFSRPNCKNMGTVVTNTGWPKSNVSKVRAYYSASDHLICNIFSGVCRVSHWFEEYLKIFEIGDYFFEWTFIRLVFHPSNMPGSQPLCAIFVWPIEIQVNCKNQSSSMTRTRNIQCNILCSSLITWGPVIGSVDKILHNERFAD